ncbi:hypothetical protein ACSBR1_007330 [Camellia fascicularis]
MIKLFKTHNFSQSPLYRTVDPRRENLKYHPSMASPSATKYPYPSSEIDVWNFVDDSLTGLTGNNYQQWRQQMHNIIEEQGLVGFINGTVEAPPEKDSESENYRSWKRSDDLLQKWIRTTLTEGICKEVKYFRTAKGLWEKLEKLFGKPIISTSSMASSPSSSNTVEYPIVSEFVKKSLSIFENNYSEWRQQMYNLIKSEGLVGLVSGAVETPAKRVTIAASDAAGCDGGGGGDKGVKEIENEDYSSWKRSDAQLRAWIGSALSKDIPEQVVQSRTAKEMWTKLEEIFGHYVPLHKAAIEGDWETANEFIKREPDMAIRAGITEESETMLIVAVKSKRRNNFVKNLVKHMLPEDLALGDTRKRTALHRAAGAGNIEAAELLVKKNPYLPNAQNYDKLIPLFYAAARGDRDMFLYLLRVTAINDDDETKPKSTTSHLSQFLSRSLASANHTLPYSQNPKLMEDGKRKGIDDLWWNPTPFNGESGFRILHQLIISGLFDIALALLRDKPELAFFIHEKEKDLLDHHSLMAAIARKPSSFRSGASFNFFQNNIYLCVPLKLENITEYKRKSDIENAANSCIYGVYSVKNRFHAVFWEVLENFVPCIKHIREKKMVHHDAHELVKFICNEIVKSNYSSAEKIFSPPLFQAISAGIHEIIEAILGSYPHAIYLRNQKKQSIFHHAVVCRHENVFNLIHQVEESKTIFLSQWDESKNNALHLAGYLAPQQQLYRRAGAALQMQRELQWFKEVEKHVVPRNKEERNYDGMTPAEVFTDKHKELVKEGEQWMKDTANACSIVAALIATVVFAAAITVPGGNNNDGGPIFNKRASFLIFGIFDAFALFSSMTSVLLFLSILTSRYAEDDFLVTLPRRLIYGLLTLFLSILSTMIAFGATLYLVFEESYNAWIIIPVFVLPGIPVCLFAFLQSPLLLDMFKSTYCSIFLKQSDGMLY